MTYTKGEWVMAMSDGGGCHTNGDYWEEHKYTMISAQQFFIDNNIEHGEYYIY